MILWLNAQQNIRVNLLLLIRSIPALPMQIVFLIKLNGTNYEDWVRSFLNPSLYNNCEIAQISYASVVDTLMYVQVCTRLDIAFVVNVLGRYLSIFPQSL